ncbi:MAG: ComEC/Rec2 family competence protein, partial [Elusimicrobia bacterium]|nr:ComEC/Rec2 family competence protein [Elusimicrobiota bacterium]
MASEPEFRGDHWRVLLKAGGLKTDLRDPFAPARGRVMARVEDRSFSPGWGDEIELEGRISRPKGPGTPGGFDDRAFLAGKGIHTRMSVRGRNWRILRQASPLSFQYCARSLRRRFLLIFESRLRPRAAALLSGIVLGKKPVEYPDMDEDFRRSGAYHLLVASGTNVGFVIALWMWIGRWILFWPRRWVWGLAIPWAFLYSGMAGADPPVMRAALMASLGILGFLMAREDRAEHAVFFSAGIMLLFRPGMIFEAGFQMSYAAVLGIVMILPTLDAIKERIDRRSRGVFAWAAYKILSLVLVSFAAQLALAPFLIAYFHRFSWIGLFTNIVAVPLAGACLVSGAVLVFLEVMWPFGFSPAAFFGVLTETLVMGLWRGVRVFSKGPAPEWPLPWNDGQVIALGALAAASLILFSGRFRNWKLFLLLWAAGLPLLHVLGRQHHENRLTLTWLDAGPGQAVVVQSPGGRVTVVDGGDRKSSLYRVVPFLQSLHRTRIDRVILTRGDRFHAEGLSTLIRYFEIDELVCSGGTWADPAWSAARSEIEKRGIPRRVLEEGDAWEEDGVRWTADPNDQELSIGLTHGGQSALLQSHLGRLA